MKKLTYLLSVLFLSHLAFGQTAIKKKINRAPLASSVVSGLHHPTARHAGSRNNRSILVNYAFLDSAATDFFYSTYFYEWCMNMNYPVDSFHNYDLKWAYQAFDIMVDCPSLDALAFPGTPYVLDSIAIPIHHVNISGLPDTIIIVEYSRTSGSTPNFNGQGLITNTVLHADTIVTSTSFSATGFAMTSIYPHLTLAGNQHFGVGIYFYGSTLDTFGLVASYEDKCNGTCVASPSFYGENSFFNAILFDQTNISVGGAQGNINSLTYTDCNSNSIKDSNDCEYFYLQNFDIDVFMSGTFLPAPSCNGFIATTSGNPASCNSFNGAAWATTSGGNSPFSYLWNTGAVSDTISNLSSGNYSVTITDSIGCRVLDNYLVGSGTLSITLSTTQAACTSSNGTATVSITGGNTPYTIHWNNNATTATITGLPIGNYTVTVTDANGCSLSNSITVINNSGTIAASVICIPATCGQSDGKAYVIATGGTSPYSYSWGTIPVQTTDTAYNLSHGVYNTTITDNLGCVAIGSGTVTEPCDSVWPGDIDGNFTVDYYDAMFLSFNYGLTGPIRPSASLIWQGQLCPSWGINNFFGVDNNNSDTNGDGIVDENDTLAITLNYGLTHQKAGPTPRTTDPVITYVPVTDTIYTNQEFHIKVMLGSQGNPVDSLCALAFSMNLDPAIFDTTGAQLTFNNSWLGTIGTNAFSFRKPLPAQGKIDMVLARKDHHNASGYGQIGEIVLKTQSHLPGGVSSSTLNLTPGIIKGITASGGSKTYNTQSTTVTIKDTTVSGIDNIAFEQSINVYPNPSNGHFVLSISQASRLLNIELMNVEGQQLYTEQLKDAQQFKKEFNLSDLAKGIYLLKVSNENGAAVKRLVVE